MVSHVEMKERPRDIDGFDLSTLAILAESYLFPILFGYYAYRSGLFLYEKSDFLYEIILRLRAGGGFTVQYLNFVSRFLYHGMLLVFNLLIVWSLLIRRKLQRKPEGSLELILPLAGTFSYLCYSVAPYLPTDWDLELAPIGLRLSLAAIGSIVNLLGVLICCLATYDLRRSFGVFVQVRPIVTRGLYRYVRHPIYLGYLFMFVGFLLIIPRFYNLVITLLSAGFTVARALLEERKLARFSPEYRAYMEQTPMLFPIKWR
jgi:protein-S-isoprenylcysteine O-methyltransferase Ste14